MATTHDGKVKNDDNLSIIRPPVVLNDIKIRTIEKTIEKPIFVSVAVERPIFIDKEYEKPVIVNKEYEKPISVEKTYEKPVIKEVQYEKPVVTDKKYERPVPVDKEYERPVIIEKEYDIPIPKEVPYDLPVVSMEKLKLVADEAINTLAKANKMLEEINKTAITLDEIINQIKARIPNEIVIPKIKYEEVIVKDVKIVEETKYVIGKIVARGQ